MSAWFCWSVGPSAPLTVSICDHSENMFPTMGFSFCIVVIIVLLFQAGPVAHSVRPQPMTLLMHVMDILSCGLPATSWAGN